MIFKKIDSQKNHLDFHYITQLYESSFPRIERRPIDDIQSLVEKEEAYNLCLLLDDQKRVGLLSFWNFDNFVFAEHFAIDSEIRGKGLGKKALETFTQVIEKPIILEVEVPEDEISIRRVSFYESFGFKLWENIPYQQPPYEKGFPFLPLKLMTYRNMELDNQSNLEEIQKQIYSKVYNIPV